MNQATLHELRAAWLAAKAAETAAIEERRSIEDAMLVHFTSKTEGTVTDKDSGVSVTYKVTRKVDSAGLQEAWETLNENAQRAFTWKADTNTRHLKALADLDPASYALVADYITVTPARAAISIKE